MPSDNPPALVVPKTLSKPSRKRPKVQVKPTVQDHKLDQKAPWVVFWASEDPKLKRVLIGCERCGCRLSFPNKTSVYRIEGALYGFRLDHQGCEVEKAGTVSPLKGAPKLSAAGGTSGA